MEKEEFSEIRGRLGKTQTKMAQVLGTSLKSVKSFEQGLRKIPAHIERQMLFLLASMDVQNKGNRPCWKVRECPLENRRNCPAWEFQIGHLCWFINGTICQGEAQESWQKKMKICRECEVFRSMLPTLYRQNSKS